MIVVLTLILSFASCGINKNQIKEESFGETQSLSVATEWAGIDFKEPKDTITLENGQITELKTYRYKTDIVEAFYTSDQDQLSVRRSHGLKGTVLAEDENTYSKAWDIDANGIAVQCFGDGNSVNLAAFDAENDHFILSCNPGSEGNGLSVTDLFALIEMVR